MAVVGFNSVIAVTTGALPTGRAQLSFFLEFANGGWIAAQTVSDYHVRREIVGITQSSFQGECQNSGLVGVDQQVRYSEGPPAAHGLPSLPVSRSPEPEPYHRSGLRCLSMWRLRTQVQ